MNSALMNSAHTKPGRPYQVAKFFTMSQTRTIALPLAYSDANLHDCVAAYCEFNNVELQRDELTLTLTDATGSYLILEPYSDQLAVAAEYSDVERWGELPGCSAAVSYRYFYAQFNFPTAFLELTLEIFAQATTAASPEPWLDSGYGSIIPARALLHGAFPDRS